jgi:Cu2+-exporting ATPase
MTAPRVCAHCALPVGRFGQRREVAGEALWFCCYGCRLAHQVRCGERDEPQAVAALIRLGIGGFLAMNVMLLSLLTYAGAFEGDDAWLRTPVHVLMWLLATPLVLLLGAPFFAAAWEAGRAYRLTTDTLVSIGVLAAYCYSSFHVLRGSDLVYFDTAAMVLLLFTLGRYLEAQGRAQAARRLAPVLAAERAEARVVTPLGESLRAVHQIAVGTLVRVLPGERIAVDGVVVDGRSQCDESVLTGQPAPCPKAPGATVYAGSLNATGAGGGVLLVRATVAGAQTRWIQIGRLVRAALARKSLAGEWIDRVVSVFIPAVLLLAVGTVWFWSERGIDSALLTGLAVLVVACPCALGLAAPVAQAIAIGEAAQRGILLRGGGVLEKLVRLRGVAFDKTGTLTRGELVPVAVRVARDARSDQIIRYACSLAAASDHPIARALRAWQVAPAATDVQVHAGAGVVGRVDGRPCALGSAGLIEALGWTLPAALASAAPPGCSVVYVGWDGAARGSIALADTPVPAAQGLCAALRARGLRLQILSGDVEEAVAPLAQALDIDTWRARLLPEDKVRALRSWARQHGPIAMVGDGLNDGPVLAAASVGIAVGGATDLAQESADVILPRAAADGQGGLAALLWLLQLAQRTRDSVRANLIWAFSYNAVALSLAASGLLKPVIAAALMAGSSALVAARSWHAGGRRHAAVLERPQPAAEVTWTARVDAAG